MAPIDEALLQTIRAKAEGDRTDAERALLAAADERASSGDEIDWEKAFQHPRFKELATGKKKAEDELKKLKEQQLKDTEQYKTLYETTLGELETERGKAGRADNLEAALKKALDAELAGLTPEAKKLIPSKLSVEDQLDWITTNRTILTRKTAQSIGAGGGRSMQATKPAGKELSQEERQIAGLFGYTVDEYSKFKDMTSVDPFAAASRRTTEETTVEPETEE